MAARALPAIRTRLTVVNRRGEREPLSLDRIAERLSDCGEPVRDRDGALVAPGLALAGEQDPLWITQQVLMDNAAAFRAGGIRTCEIDALLVNHLVSRRQPGCLAIAARLIASNLQSSVPGSFSEALLRVHAAIPERLAPEFVAFVAEHAADLDALVDPAYDFRLTFAGVRTMLNSYLLSVPADAQVSAVGYADSILRSQHEGHIAETPQFCFMRLAAWLASWVAAAPAAALSEAFLAPLRADAAPAVWADTPENRRRCALAFARRLYSALARGEITFGSPFFFNAGTRKPRIASCFLIAPGDSIESIFGATGRIAVAMGGGGGIGVHLGRLRQRGAPIRTTGGESSGLSAWMRVLREIRESVNQGGRRAGAIACYLPFYHPDVVEFLCLLRDSSAYSATGQHTPHLKAGLAVTRWFFERYDADEDFALVPPHEYPELEEIADPAEWAAAFARAQAELTARGAPRLAARALAREVFETVRQKGYPYMFYMDNANAQCALSAHARINGSNLCSEIMIPTLPDSPEDPAARPGEDGVCVLGTVLTSAHLGAEPGAPAVDYGKLAESAGLLATALDISIDLMWFSPAMGPARRSLGLHRTIGVGQAGLVGALHRLGVPYESAEALRISARTACAVYVGAAEASAQLARALGAYPSCGPRHPAARGLLQPDVAAQCGFAPADWEQAVGLPAEFGLAARAAALRAAFRATGARNAYLTSTQPTASNSIIHGTTPGADVPNALAGSLKTGAGTFFYYSPPLYAALLEHFGGDPARADAALEEVFQNDGSLRGLGLPAPLEQVYRGAFEVSPAAVIAHAAARQPYCSQAQSTNTNLIRPTLAVVMDIFKLGAALGLNTIYYTYGASETAALRVAPAPPAPPLACSRDNPDCEACHA